MGNSQGPSVAVLFLCGAVVSALVAFFVPELLAETSLGIDLGTTFSVAVVCRAGQLSVLQVDGSETVPSVVYYDPAGAVEVGAKAAAMRALAPERTVYEAKRLIGRAFDDPVVTREASNFPFALVPAAGGGVGIGIPPGNARARGAGAGRVVDPKEVGAEVLRRLKAAAERKWPARSLFGAPRQRPPGFKFGTATISVPVEFEKPQRAATIAAGKLAGFSLVRIIEEPVAAAIAYGLHNTTEERTVVVYDMGGGTLDVAVLRLQFSTRTFLARARPPSPFATLPPFPPP